MKFPNWGSLIVQYNTKLTGEIVAQLSTAVCINHYAEESQQTALLNLLELAKHATTDVTWFSYSGTVIVKFDHVYCEVDWNFVNNIA